MIISVSLLSADFSQLGNEIRKLESAKADWMHLDVMDGHFVPNLTFGAPIIRKLRPLTKKFFDVHLMVSSPENILQDFINTGAQYITIHIEATQKIKEIFDSLKRQNVKCGISLRPKTPLELINPYLDQVDLILIMSVEPGFGGQEFIPEVLTKITELQKIRASDPNKFHYLIEIDGGINADTIKQVKSVGVDVIVSGSYIFKYHDYTIPIDLLRNSK